MKNKKVILDTNLWISFLISKDFSFLDDLVESNKLKLVFSTELLHEFITVAQKPKFKKYFSKNDLERIIDFIDKYGIIIEVKSKTGKCRDSKDDFLLNLAIDSKADYLVTGDNDLLEIKFVGKTKILTIKEIISEFLSTTPGNNRAPRRQSRARYSQCRNMNEEYLHIGKLLFTFVPCRPLTDKEVF